jgi:hypothetical protein
MQLSFGTVERPPQNVNANTLSYEANRLIAMMEYIATKVISSKLCREPAAECEDGLLLS